MDYGKTHKSINETLLDIDSYLSHQAYRYIDFDGSVKQLEPTAEELFAMERFAQLRDLTKLREPAIDGEWVIGAGCCYISHQH